jgi:hypothetical protein
MPDSGRTIGDVSIDQAATAAVAVNASAASSQKKAATRMTSFIKARDASCPQQVAAKAAQQYVVGTFT